MREAYTNQPAGSPYNRAFGRWMDQQGWPRKYDNPTRNHCCGSPTTSPRSRAGARPWPRTSAALNHPTAVKRRFEAARQAKVAEATRPCCRRRRR